MDVALSSHLVPPSPDAPVPSTAMLQRVFVRREPLVVDRCRLVGQGIGVLGPPLHWNGRTFELARRPENWTGRKETGGEGRVISIRHAHNCCSRICRVGVVDCSCTCGTFLPHRGHTNHCLAVLSYSSSLSFIFNPSRSRLDGLRLPDSHWLRPTQNECH